MINNFFSRFRRPKSSVHPENTKSDEKIATNVDDDEENKHQWDRPVEFLFSLISNSVGLGNVWRFPYLAASSGGGAFLIPYFILYFLIGAPLYFLELALGQFTSRGPGTGYKMARGWRGVGIAMIFNSVLGTLYYNVVIAWALFYFVLSFRSTLLWSNCGNWWNSANCFEPAAGAIPYRENGTTWNCTAEQYSNISDYNCVSIPDKVTVTEEFYYLLLLKKSVGIDDFGVPGPYMTPLLFASWLLIFLCIFRGVQSSGKVAYFTAIFPYVVLLVLIIFSATLDGAVDGVKFYVIPKWEKLGDFKIWRDAASQVFFSLSLSFGSLIAYSAANKFDNNFFQQMCIVVSCDCFTGVFAGFAVFATIGFLAKSVGQSVEVYAASSGPGLAFITYPAALSKMPASPFFSIIFFAMLLALGLGSQFASTDVIVTALMEFFPSYAKWRVVLVAIACTTFFLCSLPFACPGGIYLFEIFQEYTANTSLVFIGFFEVLIIAYIYGFKRFMNDIYMMLGRKPGYYYLLVTWCITAPILTGVITVANLVQSKPLVEEAAAGFARYEYPQWSTILGWLIFVVCILPFPLIYVTSYIQQYKNITALREGRMTSSLENDVYLTDRFQRRPIWIAAFLANNLPSKDWGPRRRKNRVGAYAHLYTPPPNAIAMKVIDPASTFGGSHDNPTFESDVNIDQF